MTNAVETERVPKPTEAELEEEQKAQLSEAIERLEGLERIPVTTFVLDLLEVRERRGAGDPPGEVDLSDIRERIGHLRGLAEAADLIGSCWTNYGEDKDRCDDFLVAVRELNRQLALRLQSLQKILNGSPEGGASCA